MLSPQMPNTLMVPEEGRFPALPSEEEERALGIRRPAYIPATEQRTGKRPSRWRVISGVMSMVIFVVLLCSGSGFLLARNFWPSISHILGLSTPGPIRTPLATVDPAYTKGPLITPVPNANTPITGVVTARTISTGADRQQIIAQNASALFDTTGTVNVVITISNQAKINDTVSIKWIFNGVDITSSLQTLPNGKDCCAKPITNDKGMVILFSLNSPTSGNGKAQIYYNNTLAYTALFTVITPANTPTPTATAKPGTPPATTPSPSK